jgi:serine/threonine protein kinase
VTVNPSGGGTNNKQNTVVGGVVTTSTVGEDKPMSPCQVSMEDFDLLKVLGTGAYGKVFLARKKTGANAGQLFAMKVLKKQTIVQKRKTTEHTKTERQVLATIRQSPFLVTMHYAFQTPSKLHLVLGMLFMCFHFQNVKGFMRVVFPFSKKHNCKQKFVNLNLYSHYKQLY